MRTKTMHITVSRVDDALFDGEAVSVTLPGAEGEFTVLPHHEAFITPLKAGTVTVRLEQGDETFPIERGMAEVSNNQVTVLV